MKRITLMVALIVIISLVSGLVAGCTQPSPPPAPTSAPAAAATQAPAPTSAPAATAKPTDAPAAAPKPTDAPAAATKPAASTSPVAKATTAPSAATKPGGTAPGGAGDLDPDMIKAMAVMFPTAPPAPRGSSANLSQADWAGKWEGWMTIDAFKADGMKPEEQKSCDEAMAVLKNKQIPMTAEFKPSSAGAGTATFTSEGSQNPDVYDYTYKDGVITIDKDDAGAKVHYDGKTLKTDSGFAITGAWKFNGALGTGAQASNIGSIDGTWNLVKK